MGHADEQIGRVESHQPETSQPVSLPKQAKRSSHAITSRERFPLSSGLTGPGRAGTVATLFGSHGSKYTGQVLAGRPHGHGCYWAQQEGKAREQLQLVYEGSFVRGIRQGQGTAYYHSRGERYTGQWADGRRTGSGKLTYADGSVFEGMWSEDVRHGVGTLSSPGGGSIFVGTFQQDKRVGLGVTYWPGRGKKYVAEYVADAPSCGMMLPLDDDSVEAPAGQQLRNAIAAARIKAAAAAAPGACAAEMPELQLMQPSQVLCKEFGAVRHLRERQQQQQQHQQQSGGRSSSSSGAGGGAAAAGAALEAGSGTLASHTMSLLCHAFILIAGGDDLAAHVLRHQLQELVVLAGLDPAEPDVVKLLGQLQQRLDERGRGKLSLDELLDVCAFYRATPLLQAGAAEVEQQHSQQDQQQDAAGTEASECGEEWRVDDPLMAAHAGCCMRDGGDGAEDLAQLVDRPQAPVPEQSSTASL